MHSRSDLNGFFDPYGIIVDQVNAEIFCAFIFGKNLKSVQNMSEANLQKNLRLFFHYGKVEKRSRDRINEKLDMFLTA